jgi:predicted enzyme related to lactoylglutathione lyase
MNDVSYVELHTTAVEKARGFYGELFGWKFEAVPGFEGYHAMRGPPQGGGIMEEKAGSGYWLQYINVADVAASAKKAQALGGKLVQPKTEVKGMGWFAIVADPSGASFALWQKA